MALAKAPLLVVELQQIGARRSGRSHATQRYGVLYWPVRPLIVVQCVAVALLTTSLPLCKAEPACLTERC